MKVRIRLVACAIAIMVAVVGLFGLDSPAAHASGSSWYLTTEYYGIARDSCAPNQNIGVSLVWPLTGVWNACGTRIWVHEYADWWNRGWAICVSPGTVQPLIGFYQYSVNVYVSSNPLPCGVVVL